ncbi:hypothetical protein [Actinoplanes subtropicus]|uniref:hypothetical protein n=1 Tax=Actinoplanes subtropicus TaxID=543632 RepID=UPI0004C41D71|nr:hypothetical protein [Actinoplanes subtropicus]
MSELDVIVAALAAGAAAGTTNTATVAVQEAYEGLKKLLRVRLGARREGEALSAGAGRTGEQWWRERLGEALTESGALDDEEITRSARAVLEAARRPLPGVRVDRSQGVQVGDNNEQTNHFGAAPGPRYL